MALAQRRPTDELIVLYLLEAFLRRLAASPHRDAFGLKGGVLLAAYGDRRPTRDIDVQARRLDNDVEAVTVTVRAIASTPDDDGIVFDAAAPYRRSSERTTGTRASGCAWTPPSTAPARGSRST